MNELILISILVFQSYASTPSITPDDDVFKHLALTYSNNHAKMHRGTACRSGTPNFPRGITNGAAWYPLTGEFCYQLGIYISLFCNYIIYYF